MAHAARERYEWWYRRSLATIVPLILLLTGSFGMVPVARAAVANWQKAASMIPSSPTDFSSSAFQQSVMNFKAAGGNYINLIIPYYQSNRGSTDIGAGYNTPTDAALISAIQFVHAQGMKVQISLYLENRNGEWRALIDPPDRNTWFSRYGALLTRYGQLAQQQGVEQFMLGAELISVSSAAINGDNTTRWNTMIAGVRNVYSGKLLYSANRGQSSWQSELPNIQFWDKLDYIGVSAYYELGGDGSVAAMKSAWSNVNGYDITPIQNRWNKPIIFTEIGYKSVSGAHTQPWNSGLGGSYDPDEQVRDFTALFEYWNNYSFMQGIDLWWWSTDPNYGGSGNIDYTPHNKPAEQTLKQWFGSSPTNPPPPQGGTPAFDTSGRSMTPQPIAGQPVSLTAVVTNKGTGTLSNGVIDTEVYNQTNTQVFQKFSEGQTIAPGQTVSYPLTFTPSDNGTYRLAIGIFSSGWAKNYIWNDSAITLTVGTNTQPPPPQTSVTTNIWWPTDGAHVSGLQPFKAMLTNTDANTYSMYWQVDGGGLVPMPTNTADYPHKEALVDLSGWTWQGSNPYTITFVSKDGSGNTITTQSIHLLIP